MKYSKELINEVKELYPTSEEMIHHAENGRYILGRYLDDSSSGGFSPDVILAATSLEDLQSKARLLKRKIALYIKWSEEAKHSVHH
jgi:hypothetical protein